MHSVGTEPVAFQGERLTKDPIAIMPAAGVSQTMSAASRLRYAKIYPIEMNVKARDIGDVVPEDLWKLTSYYRTENMQKLAEDDWAW